MQELEQYTIDLDALQTDVMPVLKDIQKETLKARKAMDTDPVDTLTLSNKLVDLSILNQRLGDRVANAGALKRGTKNLLEVTRERHKVRLVQGINEDGEYEQTADGKNKGGVAAGVADSMKLQLTPLEFDLANEAERIYDQLSNLRKSTEKTIDALRTKISYEKTNEYNS
jgi:hypothetical protein